MDSIFTAKWIKSGVRFEAVDAEVAASVWTSSKISHSCGDAGVVFMKGFLCCAAVKKAELQITALGVYEAKLNGERVGDFILAPGWTSYKKRLQYQTYDITAMLKEDNMLCVTVGKGWRFLGKKKEEVEDGFSDRDTALIAALRVEYANGAENLTVTDSSWQVTCGQILYSNIYNGDIVDRNYKPPKPVEAVEISLGKDFLIAQQGEKIAETQRIDAKELIVTPKNETVIDFGQNLTGYVEFRIRGKKGDCAVIQHAEILDRDGDFYTENLRSAKQEIRFVCDGKTHTYKPSLSFQGFRYIKLVDWPDKVRLSNFTAVVVHSDMKRTGYFECSDAMINRLYENIVWGQRGNFLDVPTDCPQRDERLGWTGDAQAFCRAAAYNYDVEKFFTKWLADLAADQNADGRVPHVIPDVLNDGGSAAWGDAAVICPWQIYLAYGNPAILDRQFESMKKWVDFIRGKSAGYIWNKGGHFGDWLNLEADVGNKPTDKKLIATAFAFYSTSLLIKAGKVIGKDMGAYEELAQNIKAAFNKKLIKNGKVKGNTQTGCALALYFDLADEKTAVAAQLAALVKKRGHLTTGFVGAPYLLHVLTENGYTELAYDLLLRKEYPSWLYPVTMGATTIWERWNGIFPDGTLADKGMNSYNHYAYGAVGDWLFGSMAGINPDENAPGYKHIVFKPVTDWRLDFAKASLETRRGTVKAGWSRENGKIVYTFTVPKGCTADAYIEGKHRKLKAGEHVL